MDKYEELQQDYRLLKQVREPGACQCSDDEACQLARDRDRLKIERNRLMVIATKHCPIDHHDWQEIMNLAYNVEKESGEDLKAATDSYIKTGDKVRLNLQLMRENNIAIPSEGANETYRVLGIEHINGLGKIITYKVNPLVQINEVWLLKVQ